jgi:hypothetical protein
MSGFGQTNIDDAINIVGISSYIDAGGADLREIEKSLVELEEAKTVHEASEDIVSEFQKRLSLLESNLGIPMSSPSSNANVMEAEEDEQEDDDPDGDDNDDTRSVSTYASRPAVSSSANYARPQHQAQSQPPRYATRDFAHMSDEQRRQRELQEALSSINVTPMSSGQQFSLDAEKMNDKKNMLLEQINMLRTNLEDEGIKIADVQMVTTDNTFDEVESVYKQLRYRNDHARYCGFANEGGQMVAYGLEWLFDGEKSYFGFKPDLTGWSSTLNIKMRRLSYETSSLVSEGMRAYDMGNVSRLCLELIPSIVLHAKMRANKAKASSKPTDAAVASAISNIRNMDNMKKDK